MRGDREVRKVRQGASAPAPLHPPQFRGRLARGGGFVGRSGFLRPFLAEVEQRLPQLLAGFQPVGAWPVVPLLVALQLQLQTEIFEVERIGALGLLRGERGFSCARAACASAPRLLGGPLLGAIALGLRRPQQGFQRGGVFGQVRGFGGRHTSLDVVIVTWLLTRGDISAGNARRAGRSAAPRATLNLSPTPGRLTHGACITRHARQPRHVDTIQDHRQFADP